MDISRARPQLPALGLLDVEMVKREVELPSHRSHSYTSSSTASPPHLFQSAPASIGPPLNGTRAQPNNTNAWPPIGSSIATCPPSEPRRGSGDDQENGRASNRQCLPSLSEALGVDSHSSYPGVAAPSSRRSQPPIAASTTPSPDSRRPYPMDRPLGPSHPASVNVGGNGNYSQYVHYHPDSSSGNPGAPPELPRPHFPPADAISNSQHPTTHSMSRQPSSGIYTSPHDAAAVTPQQSYGANSFPSGYPSHPQSTGAAPAPHYSPATSYGPTTNTSSWHSTNSPPYASQPLEPRMHRDTVKRHLEYYDLEMAVNEISKSSSIISDFCHRYGKLMHQTQRTGPSLSLLPSIVEVDDMVKKSQNQHDALLKIREVIVSQQIAYKPPPADIGIPPPISHHESPEILSESGVGPDETKISGGKPSKRFGRAPPPGRCHSCNRAETPEWRRGPDGARTLCNACGLHYAKLTRKNNHANKSTPVTSSNLRPKETYP